MKPLQSFKDEDKEKLYEYLTEAAKEIDKLVDLGFVFLRPCHTAIACTVFLVKETDDRLSTIEKLVDKRLMGE